MRDIEDKECRKVGRKEKLARKEQLTDELLPHAFVVNSFTEGHINDRRGFVVINAAPGEAENALTAIREVAPPFSGAIVGYFHCPDFQRLRINSQMQFAPLAAVVSTMFFHFPLAFTSIILAIDSTEVAYR